MKLYSYFRSSTSYRVRIALNLKGFDYEIVPVNLLKDEQKDKAYTKLNSFQTVPALEIDGSLYTQSLAILDKLEALRPEPSFLPNNEGNASLCRQLGYAIATEVHSLNNLATLKYLRAEFDAGQSEIEKWYQTWVHRTFKAVELQIALRYKIGYLPFGSPSFFEIILIPQIYNALRFNVDMTPFPVLMDVYQLCLELPAYKKAHPENQIDYIES